MLRRTLLALAPALLIPAMPAGAAPATEADTPDLDRLAAYLNAVRTLRARFEQTAADGTVSTGTVWLERPGRMRFEYDPPSPLLLVANHGEIVFRDAELKQVSRIPLERTPLSILLGETITFSGRVTVTDIQRQPNQIQLSVVQTYNQGEGLLAIVFTLTPLGLQQWTVVDAQHRITRVSLANVETGGSFQESLFNLPSSDG